ncbi:hypothetical protein J5X84_33930 [Streptosporangiaceae bacterium NEAU-GS5]|nr:hypothetical protein [Streptosporangiaceae bacterium NEAU-GS5]
MRFPVSFAQLRMWFIDRLAPGEAAYNMPCSFWLDGPLDADALQRAMDTLAARHAILRTSIVAFDGTPEQVVADHGTIPIERVELPAEPTPGERGRQAEAIADDLACRPFDLTAGPPIRAALITAGPDRHLLVLVLHYSIGDGASMRILIDELSACYRAETTGTPPVLPTLWLEYGDYAVWQRDRMRGEALQRQLGYWRGQLLGAPRLLTLPTDRPRPARRSSRGELAAAHLDAATTQRLAAVAHGANATMFMVFLMGFAATLSRYARQHDILIGTQVAGRTHAELEPVLGAMTNIVVLRMRLDGDPSFTELLGRARDTTLDALAHEQLPFEKLVQDLAPDRTLAHTPLIQAQFLYGALKPPDPDLPGITAHGRALPTHTAKLDLTMYADAGDRDGTALTLEYSTDLWDRGWADRFLRRMATLLEHAADAPGTRVSDLPMLTAAERSALPLTPTATLDRGALPAPQRGDVPPAGRVGPRTPAEATVARMLADLLGLTEPIGVHDNFFDLGGHSLTTTRLVACIVSTYGVDLPVHQVFSTPTVAGVAAAVSAHPDFTAGQGPPRHAGLDSLSDKDLDDLLRAAIAQRNRRRTAADDRMSRAPKPAD